MPETSAKTVSVTLDADIGARIGKLAEARHRAADWLIGEAVKEYVEREEQREDYKQQALQVWDEYRSAGLHAAEEKTDGWLAKLSEGVYEAPPKCHV